MTSVGLFEAKTKFSELCDRVSKNKESILVTKRGEPFVMISPTGEQAHEKSVWELRQTFKMEHGKLKDELIIPRRLKSKKKANPLDD